MTRQTFESHLIVLPLAEIKPQRKVGDEHRKSAAYKQIAASLEEIGLIEPFSVFPTPDGYLLLDGHMRHEALLRSGVLTAICLVQDQDEAYTYNRRVSTIPPVAQHLMLMKALDSGLTEERIAKSLQVDVSAIRRKKNLLNGICDEAVELLQTRKVSERTFQYLRRMKPIRQVQASEHMIASANYSAAFSRALLLATRPEMLNEQPLHARKISTQTREGRLLALESDGMLEDLKRLEGDLGQECLSLTIFQGYVNRVLQSPKIDRYLKRKHPEMLAVLQEPSSGTEVHGKTEQAKAVG